MGQEEIEIFKDIRAVLSEAIDKLESLNAVKEPREFWVVFHSETYRPSIISESELGAYASYTDDKIIKVREVIE